MPLKLYVGEMHGSYKVWITQLDSHDAVEADVRDIGGDERVIEFLSIDDENHEYAIEALCALANVNIHTGGSIGSALENILTTVYNAGRVTGFKQRF